MHVDQNHSFYPIKIVDPVDQDFVYEYQEVRLKSLYNGCESGLVQFSIRDFSFSIRDLSFSIRDFSLSEISKSLIEICAVFRATRYHVSIRDL